MNKFVDIQKEIKEDAIKRIDGAIAALFSGGEKAITAYFSDKDSSDYAIHKDYQIKSKIILVNNMHFQIYAIWGKNRKFVQIYKTETELLDCMKKYQIVPNTCPPNED